MSTPYYLRVIGESSSMMRPVCLLCVQSRFFFSTKKKEKIDAVRVCVAEQTVENLFNVIYFCAPKIPKRPSSLHTLLQT